VVKGLVFLGEQLRLARFARGFTLDELGQRVGATRQYLNQLENGGKTPTDEMAEALAIVLGVTRRFFWTHVSANIRPEQCHFRKQSTTPVSVVSQVIARGTLLDRFVTNLDAKLELPAVNFPDRAIASLEETEEVAEEARAHWRLGNGPILNMMRVVEGAGAVVSFFDGVSERVDALSIDRPRPLIVRSEAKQSACRLRFDLAHECGHLIMHRGVQTGDRATEDQANRFANAFLLPRTSFVQEFPRGRTLDWNLIFDLKLRWKVSAAAIVRRAYDLGRIDAAQYRTGYIHLQKSGQRRIERFDDVLKAEEPEMLHAALSALDGVSSGAARRLAEETGIEDEMFETISGLELPPKKGPEGNVVQLFA